MLAARLSDLRIFLHVLAATVWVGGQLTLVGILPVLRRVGEDAPRAVARRFNHVAWAAYAVLVATGIWNILAVRLVWASPYGRTLSVKLVAVGLSGLAAFVHSRATSKAVVASTGAVSLLAALAALFFGVQLG